MEYTNLDTPGDLQHFLILSGVETEEEDVNKFKEEELNIETMYLLVIQGYFQTIVDALKFNLILKKAN